MNKPVSLLRQFRNLSPNVIGLLLLGFRPVRSCHKGFDNFNSLGERQIGRHIPKNGFFGEMKNPLERHEFNNSVIHHYTANHNAPCVQIFLIQEMNWPSFYSGFHRWLFP